MSKVEITDEMVEAAARALCEAWGYCWDGDPDDYQTAPEGSSEYDYDERPSKKLYREAARMALDAIAPLIAAQERERANAASAQAAHMAYTMGRIKKRLESAGIDTSLGAEIGVHNLVEWYTKLIREIDAVHAAIPPNFLLVPPDGGDVRTSQAVAAMTERLAACACSRPNTNPPRTVSEP